MSRARIPVEVSVEDVFKAVTRLRQWLKEREWKRTQEFLKKGRQHGRLYDFIKWKYSEYPIMEHAGSVFPNAIFEAPANQLTNPESVLKHPLDIETPETIMPAIEQVGKDYLSKLQETPAKPWDGTTYRMLKIENKDCLRISCGLGSYFNMIKSCDVLELEILKEFLQRSPSKAVFGWFDKQLVLRHALESEVPHAVTNGQGRSAAVAISTLIVFQVSRQRYKALVWERSFDRVSVHTDLIHVVPSFMFQPMLDEFDKEYSVTHNIYREYLEEVFNIEEVKRPKQKIVYNYFYQDPNLLYLQELMKEDKARIYFTGIAVNLLNLRPEICTLLLIQTNEWFENHSVGRKVRDLQLRPLTIVDEFKSIDELHARGKRGNQLLELSEDLTFPRGSLRPENFVPPGSAALYLGLRIAQDILL